MPQEASDAALEVMWALSMTVFAVFATCAAVASFKDPPYLRGIEMDVAVVTITGFSWFVAACMWREALK